MTAKIVAECDRLIAFYAAAQSQAEKMARAYQRQGGRDATYRARASMLRHSCFSVFVKELQGLRDLASQHSGSVPAMSDDVLNRESS